MSDVFGTMDAFALTGLVRECTFMQRALPYAGCYNPFRVEKLIRAITNQTKTLKGFEQLAHRELPYVRLSREMGQHRLVHH